MEEWILRKYEDLVTKIERCRKEDLKLVSQPSRLTPHLADTTQCQPNHLLGYRRTFIQLFFKNQNDLFTVRRELLPLATKNRGKLDAVDTYAEVISGENGFDMDFDMEDGIGNGKSFAQNNGAGNAGAPSDSILDIREYDLPYYLRVAIDKGEMRSISIRFRIIADVSADVRVGLWYEVTALHGDITIEVIKERVSRAEPVVMAFDIETTKAPLKFPDNQQDQVMMISYMIDGQVSRVTLLFKARLTGTLQGFLITNREIISADIEDFEYTPSADYEGPFVIFNEADEVGHTLRSSRSIADSDIFRRQRFGDSSSMFGKRSRQLWRRTTETHSTSPFCWRELRYTESICTRRLDL